MSEQEVVMVSAGRLARRVRQSLVRLLDSRGGPWRNVSRGLIMLSWDPEKWLQLKTALKGSSR